jgi:protein FAM32A
MPSEDYASATRGSLKIKGVQGSKVEKHKKKKKKTKDAEQAALQDGVTSGSEPSKLADKDASKAKDTKDSSRNEVRTTDDDEDDLDSPTPELSKTETERRFEERRKKLVSSL